MSRIKVHGGRHQALIILISARGHNPAQIKIPDAKPNYLKFFPQHWVWGSVVVSSVQESRCMAGCYPSGAVRGGGLDYLSPHMECHHMSCHMSTIYSIMYYLTFYLLYILLPITFSIIYLIFLPIPQFLYITKRCHCRCHRVQES